MPIIMNPIIMNSRIAAIPHLDSFLADHPRAVAGWGRKASGMRAGLLGALLRRPVLRLEDGFLRSIARREGPLSLMLDTVGVYYDATRPSAMEQTIAQGSANDARALALAHAWRAAGFSKYNHRPDPREPVTHPYVLVADQCQGDAGLRWGLAGTGSAVQDRFERMIQTALDEHPDCVVLVKTHPDLLSHGRKGLLRPDHIRHPRLRVMAHHCHPAGLIAGARAIYTLTSLIGFEGLIWGRPVRCFAMPFYAGWGLTQDEMPAPARRGTARIEDLLHAAFIDLPRYADPLTGRRWSAEEAFADAALRLSRQRTAQRRRAGMETRDIPTPALPAPAFAQDNAASPAAPPGPGNNVLARAPPSSALYFTNACAPLIARWWHTSGARPIRAVAPNSFVVEGERTAGWC
jgi:capsular polysaccharide export protein